MGEKIIGQGLEPVLWQFYLPTEEEKAQRIVVRILCDIKGCHRDDFEHIVRFNNIKVVSKLDNPRTINEYRDVDLIFENNAFDDVDDDLIFATKREVRNVLYKSTFLMLPEIRDKIEIPFDIMKSNIY